MLSETDLDISGSCLRLSFPSFALVFTDPGTLEIAESLLSQEEDCGIRGLLLRILTVYIRRIPAIDPDISNLDLAFVFDACCREWPYLLDRQLWVRPEADLPGILDSRAPDLSANSVDPVFLGHAPGENGAGPEGPAAAGRRGKRATGTAGGRNKPGAEGGGEDGKAGEETSAEEIFYLPRKIPISHVACYRRLPKTETGRRILKRFLVRGHWRRSPSWNDFRLRWVEPYWKGPDLGRIIEKEYLLKPCRILLRRHGPVARRAIERRRVAIMDRYGRGAYMYYPDKIKPFLLHPVESVRNFAGDYFYNRHYQPPDPVEQVFKAVDLHGGETCTHLLSAARQYQWKENQLLRVVEGIEAAGGQDGSASSKLLKRQYEFLLLCAPCAFLLEHRERLLRFPFTAHHRTILERFFALRDFSARSLFEELMRCAADPGIAVDIRNLPYDYGRFLGRQLGRIAQGATLAEFGALCADPSHWDRWPAILLHEAIRQDPHFDLTGIVRHLGHIRSPAGDAIIYTVREIGDSALAEHLIAQAERRGGDGLIQTLEALPSIKHDAVRRFCLQRLEKTRGGAERALLCLCLTSLVDEASFSILERVEARGDYDPGWVDLGVRLLIVKVILNDDRMGRSKESRMLMDHDQRDRQKTKEMLGFMESLLEGSP